MIDLTYPWLLILLPLPYLCYQLLPEYRQKAPAYRIPFFKLAAHAAKAHISSGSQIHSKAKLDILFASIIWLCCVIAATKPVLLEAEVNKRIMSRDIMLAIDLSGSMDEQDFNNNTQTPIRRLDAVKNVVSDFINTRNNDRIGLIVFGTRAYLQVPFTEDLAIAEKILADSSVAMAGPHTAIGDAIGLALKSFEESKVTDKALILLTDGADTGSRMSPINAAHIAKTEQLKIFTIGIGDEHGEGQYKVDFDTLSKIADITGGQFYRAINQAELQRIYSEIDKITLSESDSPQPQKRTSLVHLPLLFALLIYLIALSLHAGNLRKIDG